MPVTAKLSRKFYETLGDEVANELVNWSDLAELNDLNFARFTAEMDARFAEFRAEMDRRFAELKGEMDRRFAEFGAEMDRRFAESDAKLAGVKADLIKWMFAFWAPTALASVGTLAGVVAILLRR